MDDGHVRFIRTCLDLHPSVIQMQYNNETTKNSTYSSTDTNNATNNKTTADASD